MSKNHLSPQDETPKEKKVRKRRDFWLGVIFSIGMNLIIYGLFAFEIIPSAVALWLPWILNIAVIVYFALIQMGDIVLGILASYGIFMVITLCISFASCFGLKV